MECMQLNSRIRIVVSALIASATLAGCGVPASAPDPYSSVVIKSYGPKQIQAGVPFNKQPDGSAAAWMRVNRSLSNNPMSMYFDGVKLTTVIRGSLVTGLVPAALYAKPGTHALWIAGKDLDGNKITSNKVKMIAK